MPHNVAYTVIQTYTSHVFINLSLCTLKINYFRQSRVWSRETPHFFSVCIPVSLARNALALLSDRVSWSRKHSGPEKDPWMDEWDWIGRSRESQHTIMVFGVSRARMALNFFDHWQKELIPLLNFYDSLTSGSHLEFSYDCKVAWHGNTFTFSNFYKLWAKIDTLHSLPYAQRHPWLL